MAALDVFESKVGEPERTIAWGESLGGVITGAIVERFPDRVDGAIPTCHGLGGTVRGPPDDRGFVHPLCIQYCRRRPTGLIDLQYVTAGPAA